MNHKTKIIATFLLILINTHFSYKVFALDSTPTATQATPSSEVVEDEGDIEKIRQAVKDKVKEKIDQIINKPNQKTGWVGQITDIVDDQIFLTCQNKDTRVILVDDDTNIINSKRQQVELSDLKSDQIILAMGYVDEQGQLLAKRILITNEPVQNLINTIVLATVTDISQTTSIMTLVTNDRQVFQVKTDKTTKDLVKNQKIIVVLKQETDSTNSWQIVDFKILNPLPTPTTQ